MELYKQCLLKLLMRAEFLLGTPLGQRKMIPTVT